MERKKKFKKIFNRYTALIVIMVVLFAIIGAQLYNLQVANGQYYSDTANTKAHKLITIAAPRGLITDKNGIALATEVQSYNLTYTDTDEAGTKLFATLQKAFKILDDNGESQTDSFPLKVGPYRFEFTATTSAEIETMQLRFLKDRGFQDSILKHKFSNKKEADLTSSETTELNDELLKLTPETIYNSLLKQYGVIKGISSLKIQATPDVIRKYLIVKDSIKMNSFSGYKSVNIASNIKKDTSLIFKQSLSELPGINVENQPMRQYPYDQLGSSVLGYISKINPDEQEKYSEKGYDTSSDYVGAAGIESAMESQLKGDNGGDVVQVDKQGRVKNELASRQASPGNNVQLTIDANVQYATENALSTEMKTLQAAKTSGGDLDVSNATRGAAVAIDIHTGGILALASLPGFNPNDFATSQGLTEAQIEKYFTPDYEKMAKAQNKPQSLIDYMFPIDTSIKGNTTIRKDKFDYYPKYLYNYATMSLIPSGSTFKPMTAIAGLETGAINAGYTYDDEAVFDIGGGHLLPFKSDGPHGRVNVVSAIQLSSNPFFMSVGGLLRATKSGDDTLAKYAWQFGLGADPSFKNPGTGIEINENFGQVYNTVSQKNNSAIQFLLNIEEDLTNGVVAGTGGKLPQLDLYDRDNDINISANGKKLSEIKTEIKKDITDSVKNGTFSKTNYTDLFKQLVDTDPKYKGKNITDSDVQAVVNDVYYEAVQTGHGSLSLPYNIYEASIGQGMNNFTPLQLANYVATIANGGTRYKLHLVDNVKDSSGKIVSTTKPEVIDKADMSATTRALVMQGMNGVTAQGAGGQAGTAYPALGKFPIPSGGKTGTAEFSTPEIQGKVGRGDYGYYVGYAPADNPQIAIAVVIFDGGYGSDVANVARGMYEGYFKNDPRMANYSYDIDTQLKPVN
ncbi:penicillin-binding transpeptidase domain-containing protein [Clostridium akagii]|uniref:penicillin-binding transpeptidase domain-containing protein n=1 Tax=Clostridium akagii TaxID=91623 RepID=UPI0005666222|nr:penicillin-binding transpeptidase domain-containing protein [Clostridium akagii]